MSVVNKFVNFMSLNNDDDDDDDFVENYEENNGFLDNNYDNKSMLIKVTDSELLEKTGGIIQRYEWFSYYSEW